MKDACRNFEGWLARSADGALNANDQARLDLHLDSCADCRAALTDQQAARAMLLAHPVTNAPSDFARRVLAGIDNPSWWLDRLDFRVWTWRLLPVAGALSLAAWLLVQPVSVAEPASIDSANLANDLPVVAALWDASVSDTAMLSLMLSASATDRLSDTYRER